MARRLLSTEGDDGYYHIVPSTDSNRMGGCISRDFLSDFKFAVYLVDFVEEAHVDLYEAPFLGELQCNGIRRGAKFPKGLDPFEHFESFFRLNTLIHRYAKRSNREFESVFDPILERKDSKGNLFAKTRCMLAWHPLFTEKYDSESYQRRVVQVIRHTKFIPAQFLKAETEETK